VPIINMDDKILLSHGGGGKKTQDLIRHIFLEKFSNEELNELDDGAVIGDMIITTDSFVVNPLFFPGGDIGKLSISGTVNDIVAMGGTPLFLSAGFIIEEGFPLEDLKKIVDSMSNEAKAVPVKIVTGDTKVVEKGKGDGIYINTTGFGKKTLELGLERIKPGNKIIITGTVGDHGASILLSRNQFEIESGLKSDCAPLYGLLKSILSEDIKFMRDPTRGGLAAVLNEIVRKDWGIEIFEDKIPIREDVKGICEMLGIDPITMANEGKMVIFVEGDRVEETLKTLHMHPLGRDASIIGKVTDQIKGRVVERTVAGTTRIIDMPSGESLPRIC